MTTKKQLHVSWEMMEQALGRMGSTLLGERPFDYVIGLERGGVFPAYLLQRRSPKFCGALICIRPEMIETLPEEILSSRLLIVDDIWDSGQTILKLLCKLNEHTRFVTLWSKEAHTIPQHTYGALTDLSTWVVFPWETEDYEEEN